MKTFRLSIAFNALVLCAGLIALNHKGGVAWIKSKFAQHAEVRDNRLSVFDALPITPEDTVFIGDSILALGEWSELMNDVHCKNRAVSGSTTADVLARLQPIIDGKPRGIVMLVGINDLQARIPRAATVANYHSIISRIKSDSPKTKVFLLPPMAVNQEIYSRVIAPLHPEIHAPTLQECDELRHALNDECDGDAVTWRWAAYMLQENSQLREEFTNDGLHLNGRGLVELAKILKE